MKTSQFLLITQRETPADAEVISHQLMLRAGMIRKTAAGIYTWLPLGLRVLKKVENIVREEMNKIGAQELLMPAIQPAELWEESQRWETFGNQLLKISDRHERRFCFGPTHEEVITDLARNDIRSYKQLPLTLYQIQSKFRDEIRPRFGVMRAREFLMKDAYSFHLDETSMGQTYAAMFGAYSNIFSRIGLKFRAVLADTGSIGGSFSHEFHVLADSGEDILAFSDNSDYAANIERAESLKPKDSRATPTKKMQKVDTPGQYTIKDVSEYLDSPAENSVKTLIVVGTKDELVGLVLRGDHELNELKAAKLDAIASPLQFADPKDIQKKLNCQIGSIGPVGLSIPYIIDRDAAVLSDFVCGANEDDKHYQYVNWERDAALAEIADLRKVKPGDLSPDGKGSLQFTHGIEVGHIFQLGDKYSKLLNATVLDENGKSVAMMMGCYGIGVSRIVAAAIEQHHDEKGIIWPEAITPFQISLIPINLHNSYRLSEVCEKLYLELTSAGFEVLFDDRKERPGVLFADSDLIGIPHRLVISEKGLDTETIEYKARTSSETINLSLKNCIQELKKIIY